MTTARYTVGKQKGRSHLALVAPKNFRLKARAMAHVRAVAKRHPRSLVSLIDHSPPKRSGVDELVREFQWRNGRLHELRW